MFLTGRFTDVDVNLGTVDPEADFFGPLQKLLDQCRSAKVLSKFVFMYCVDVASTDCVSITTQEADEAG